MHRQTAAVVLLVLANFIQFAWSSTDAQENGAVPTFRGDSGRTGQMPGPGPGESPISLWQVGHFDEVNFAPVVSDEIIYLGTGYDDAADVGFGGEATGLHAFDANTGERLWQFCGESGKCFETFQMPTVAGGMVFAGSDAGPFYALNGATGEVLWRYEQDSSSAPVVADGLVFLGKAGDSVPVALDMATGEERWRADGPWGTPLAVQDGTVYVAEWSSTNGAVDFALHALNAASGAERWRVELDADWLVAAYDTVFVGVTNHYPGYISTGSVIALDSESGNELWRFVSDEDHLVFAPAVGDGRVYLPMYQEYDSATNESVHGGDLLALDAATGAPLWRLDDLALHPGAGNITPSVAEGVIYFVVTDSVRTTAVIAAVDAVSGERLWSFPLPGFLDLSYPVVTSDMLYISGRSTERSGYEYFLLAIGAGSAPQCPEIARTLPSEPLGVSGYAATMQDAVLLRAAPSNEGVIVAELPECTLLSVISSEELSDAVWWQVEDPLTGESGYVEEDYLQAAYPEN